MIQQISLNGIWELRGEPLACGLDQASTFTRKQEGWIDTPVPGDIHQGLVAAGEILEPLVGLNSFDCEWTEKKSWWYRKTFEIQSDWLEAERIELELNGLDSNAEILINGNHLGSHRNTFRPFRLDVKPWLQVGENILLVRLTAGVENISEADVNSLDGVIADSSSQGVRTNRGDARRVFVRKPQYTFGWDWSPRLVTTAIAGDVTLQMMDKACLRHVRLFPDQNGEQVVITVTATIDLFHYYKTTEGQLTVTLLDEAGQEYQTSMQTLLQSGLNFVEVAIPITQPQLWWPNGLGAQHLYNVEVDVSIAGETISNQNFTYGLRFVELETTDGFAVIINGKRLFCKGANWIPADALYARVGDDQYDMLIREAQAANFNMLRIWGGGWYERDAFYQACDRLGIMVWQDFMFACAPYPDYDDGFCVEVEREAEYQTKRLQRHASIVLFCGSNENHWGFKDWWHELTKAGAQIYNYILPSVVQRNCPEIPYWNGSPYGGDAPNSNEVGNHHHWGEAMMNPNMKKRITPEEYDRCTAKFITEFGYVGACSQETTRQYLDDAPLIPNSEVWQHHTNTFEKNTVAAGIAKHYTDPDTLPIEEYLLYSALCQGMMLSYALESMRARFDCGGGLFWMFNDTWGELGWTIMDYYLRRKPAWYFVRRAFAPVRMILRSKGDKIACILANDTAETVSQKIEYGYIRLDGQYKDFKTVQINAEPLTRTLVCAFGRGNHDPTVGLWVTRAIEPSIFRPAIYRAVDYRDLQITKPGLAYTLIHSAGQLFTLKISAQAYAHAVHVKLPENTIPSDNYFDLLPGETREIQIAYTGTLTTDSIQVSCVNE